VKGFSIYISKTCVSLTLIMIVFSWCGLQL